MLRCVLALPPSLGRLVAGRATVIDGQQLHWEEQVILKVLGLRRRAALHTLTTSEARGLARREALFLEGPKVTHVEVRTVRVEGGEGDLDARLYSPTHRDFAGDEGGAGLLLFFHCGGFVLCDLDTHDNACRFLSVRSGVKVLSVAYRLAPEAPFPAAVVDALAAFDFVLRHHGA
jgi:acetyl esterase